MRRRYVIAAGLIGTLLAAFWLPVIVDAVSGRAADAPGQARAATQRAQALGRAKKATKTPTPPRTLTPTPAPSATATVPPASPTPPGTVILAAGDIAACDSNGDEATVPLLLANAGTILTLGDNAYESGTSDEFAECYAPSWGQVRDRTRPAPGNHDYVTSGGIGYYAYFGAAAGDPATGYYSFDAGGWQIIAINSNCGDIGGCGAGSPQERWLREDLAAHPAACTIAYWHHPRFSSGQHGNSDEMEPIWQALYDANADIVLSGHDHNYERFAPQTPAGAADAARGIREFVVGTGGRSLRTFGTTKANSEVRDSSAYGLLKLTLRASGYDWQFIPQAGKTFTDSGSGACH